MTSTTTIFQHQRIYTSSHEPPISGGIVVQDGQVTFVGALADCEQLAGDEAATVTLSGEAVLPGFHDAHIHTGSLALQFNSPDVSLATSREQALAELREWANANPGTDWVVGGRWDANRWGPGESLHRNDLDEIFGDRPAVLNTIDGHSVCANSRALQLTGVDESTPEIDGGVIERDDDGRLSGVLRENASDYIRVIAEKALLSRPDELLTAVQRHLHERGIVAITDLDGDEIRRGYEALEASDKLRLRVRKGIPATSLDDAVAAGERSGQGTQWLMTGSVKLFSDGALGSHTALMHEGYEGDSCNCGVAVISEEDLLERVRFANSNGIAVSTHAIGDKANTNVLDAYEQVASITRSEGLHNSVEHAQHIRAEDIDRYAKFEVIASMQPTHCTSDYPLSVHLLGERQTLHYPWRSLLDAGVHLVFGSDAPIEPADPLFGIHAAVTRQRRDGEPDGGREPDQRLSVAEAIAAFTEQAARMDEREGVRGRIEAGAFADFVVLGTDPFEVEPANLYKITVETTVVGGEVVYCGEGAGQ